MVAALPVGRHAGACQRGVTARDGSAVRSRRGRPRRRHGRDRGRVVQPQLGTPPGGGGHHPLAREPRAARRGPSAATTCSVPRSGHDRTSWPASSAAATASRVPRCRPQRDRDRGAGQVLGLQREQRPDRGHGRGSARAGEALRGETQQRHVVPGRHDRSVTRPSPQASGRAEDTATSSVGGCRRASPPARRPRPRATPSAGSCGSSRRLRLSSANPGKRARPMTWSHSSTACSRRGSRLMTGPKNATPSGRLEVDDRRADVLAGQRERLVGLGLDRPRPSDSSSSASARSAAGRPRRGSAATKLAGAPRAGTSPSRPAAGSRRCGRRARRTAGRPRRAVLRAGARRRRAAAAGPALWPASYSGGKCAS